MRLAREAREASDDRGSQLLIAGAVGPAISARNPHAVGDRQATVALVEQAVALAEACVDVLIFETFGDIASLTGAIPAVVAATGLPVIAQMTFLEDGRTIAGDTPEAVAAALENLDVAVIGANCTVGPNGMRDVVERLSRATTMPLSVQPNAGPPVFSRGRFQYQQNEDYFARTAIQFVRMGASIVGGCCGTTPHHIEAIANAVRGLDPGENRGSRRGLPLYHEHREIQPVASRIGARLQAGEFVVGCELRPPEGSDPDAMLADVGRLRDLGVDAIVIAPSPQARAHISPVTFGLLLRERLGVEAILTQTTFEKSMLSLQADLLGAHTFGLQAVLCQTGTPMPEGAYPTLSGVEVSSIDLIAMLNALNEARDFSGGHLHRATSFFVGGRVNPSALDLEGELERTRAKIAAGASFFITDPTYDITDLVRFCDALAMPQVPLLLGVTALRDLQHAEYLRYEVPGVNVPDRALALLRDATGPDTGLEIAANLVWQASGYIRGVVAMPSLGDPVGGAHLVNAILGTERGWHLPTRFDESGLGFPPDWDDGTQPKGPRD